MFKGGPSGSPFLRLANLRFDAAEEDRFTRFPPVKKNSKKSRVSSGKTRIKECMLVA
jgi:hypothetical protein